MYGRQHVFHRQTEFVLVEPGGDLRMGVRIDVGIDAKGHIGDFPFRRSQRIDDFQFGKTLYVEATDPQFKRNLYFPV